MSSLNFFLSILVSSLSSNSVRYLCVSYLLLHNKSLQNLVTLKTTIVLFWLSAIFTGLSWTVLLVSSGLRHETAVICSLDQTGWSKVASSPARGWKGFQLRHLGLLLVTLGGLAWACWHHVLRVLAAAKRRQVTSIQALFNLLFIHVF